MRIALDPAYPPMLVALVAVMLVGLVMWTYPRRVAGMRPLWRRLLIGLRLLMVLAIVAAMLRPAIEYSEDDERPRYLVLLADRSRSMTTADEVGGISRREAMLKMLEEDQEELSELDEKTQLEMYDFAQELKSVDQLADVADGDATAIGHVLEQVRRDYRGKRLVAVVLMSDGAARTADPEALHPLVAAQRLAEDFGAPIYPVTFGSSDLVGRGIDLAVEDMLVDPFAFEKKTVPIRTQVRLVGAAGRKVRVRLLLEDRQGLAFGESGELRAVPSTAENQSVVEITTDKPVDTVPVELSFVAERPGEYVVGVEVEAVDEEIRLSNNMRRTLLTVREGGLRVAYFDAARWEQKFIRKVNRTAKVQLDFLFLPISPTSGKTFPTEWLEPDAYDVYLVGDLSYDVLRGAHPGFLDALAERVDEGAGLLMLGGAHAFDPAIARSRLGAYLPGEPVGAETWNSQPVKLQPTREGINHYLMRLSSGSGAGAQLWQSLPALQGRNVLRPRSDAVEVLAESERGEPLLIVQDVGTARVGMLAVGDTWRWHLHGHEGVHQQFWQQMLLWLAHKEDESDQPLWVKVDPRTFDASAPVPIFFGARDAEGAPVTDATFEVQVAKPGGDVATLAPESVGAESTASFVETSEPGDYWLTVSGRDSAGNSLGSPASTRFIVQATDLETDNPTADPDLMNEIAAVSGGRTLTPEQFGGWLQSLEESSLLEAVTRRTRQSLWDGWPFLIAFLVLLTTEWTIRKTRGLV